MVEASNLTTMYAYCYYLLSVLHPNHDCARYYINILFKGDSGFESFLFLTMNSNCGYRQIIIYHLDNKHER